MADDLERRLEALGELDVPPAPAITSLSRHRPAGWWILSAAAVVVILIVGVLVLEDGDDEPSLVQTTDPTSPTTAPPSPEPPTSGPPISNDSPPPVVVRGGDATLELQPWTFCWVNLCADGFPPEEPEDIGNAPSVQVDFPVPAWGFEASFEVPGQECGRIYPATLTQDGPTSFRLEPHGPAGTYDVTLFGRGGPGAEPGGDLFVTFRWTTTKDGPLPEPSATTSILADHDGAVDSYGVELGAAHLATTPTTATASVVVSAANGEAVTLDLSRMPSTCDDGSVSFRDAPALGLQAATLGPPPFRYDVTLVLDGVTYTATATWPDDVDPECSPCVPLEFDPPLPALTG